MDLTTGQKLEFVARGFEVLKSGFELVTLEEQARAFESAEGVTVRHVSQEGAALG
jgi:hypothetical protein